MSKPHNLPLYLAIRNTNNLLYGFMSYISDIRYNSYSNSTILRPIANASDSHIVYQSYLSD